MGLQTKSTPSSIPKAVFKTKCPLRYLKVHYRTVKTQLKDLYSYTVDQIERNSAVDLNMIFDLINYNRIFFSKFMNMYFFNTQRHYEALVTF